MLSAVCTDIDPAMPADSIRNVDPRSTITEDSFQISPELLGLPLARPSRRAAAMAVDGILVAILANAPGVLFGLAAAVVLFRVSAGAGGGYVRRSFRMMFRVWGAVVLFGVVVSMWGRIGDQVKPAGGGDRGTTPYVAGVDGLRTFAEVIAFSQATTEAEAHQRADNLVEKLRQHGTPEPQMRQMVRSLRQDLSDPILLAAADSVLRSLETKTTPDSLSAPATPEDERLAAVRDSVRELQAELRDAERDQGRLAQRLEDASKPPSILEALRSFADDLGLGFGWSGLYFTAFVALWNGRTPGKRLFGIRIIRLDGKPLGWWAAFERFGGYAAGFATGLLGFAQVLWDRNRQAVHDKIAETVVIRG